MKYIVQVILLSIVLAVSGLIAFAYFSGMSRDQEARLVGALSFVADEIEASAQVLKADVFYAPSIEMQGEPDVWTVSGLAVIQGASGGTYRMKYSAVVRNLCESYTDGSCWRLEALSVGEQTLAAAQIVVEEAADTESAAASPAVATAEPTQPLQPSEAPAPQEQMAQSEASEAMSPSEAAEQAAETAPGRAITTEGGGSAGTARPTEPAEGTDPAIEDAGQMAPGRQEVAAAAQPAASAVPAKATAADPAADVAAVEPAGTTADRPTSGTLDIEGLGQIQLPGAGGGEMFLPDEVSHFSCTKADYRRDVFVKYLGAAGDPPCSVIYEKRPPEDPSTKIIWHADHERGFCEYRAKEFVEKLRDMDWDCAPLAKGERAGE